MGIFTSSNTTVSLPALKNPPTTTSTTKKKTKTKETQRKNEVQQQESTTTTITTPTPPKKRSASARRLRIETTSPPAAHAEEKKAVQIPRKHFQVVHAIFKEHDADGDGLITREEFVKAVQRLESRDYVGRQIVRGCHSETRSV